MFLIFRLSGDDSDMKISGFTFIKNADKLFIPIKESVQSILPIVDEFIIAVGDNDSDDRTLEIIDSIKSSKIKLLHTVWDKNNYKKNTIFAQQTDLAKDLCTGDWLFYIQGDEVLHESSLPNVVEACKQNLMNEEVEGFVFDYLHFWGDFDHYHYSHSWYKKEVRIIRNDSKIHSWKDAQSFRYYSQFSGTYEDYQSNDNRKLRVKEIAEKMFHYGYVRPPKIMSYKKKESSITYRGKTATDQKLKRQGDIFDYGPIQRLNRFQGTHPAVMSEWISQKFIWKDQIQLTGSRNRNRPIHKHEKIKYRIISWIENNLFGGRTIGGFKNYISI